MPIPNFTLVLILVSFVIFMILMKGIYFDPILAIKQKRERQLIDDQESARQAAADYERTFAEYQAALKQARVEAHQLVQKVREEAKASAQATVQKSRLQSQHEMDSELSELHRWQEVTYQKMATDRATLTQAIVAKVTAGPKVRTASGT